ncbi:MAG: hypothetical protein HY905_05855 [Deltaproteobacteria bacterium]|nr:hypothetical protein [Deltaproteobacteria bacterium]
MNRKTWWLAVGTAAALLTPACMDERPAIDRVQPLALRKAFFVGEDLESAADDPEFWTQGTLIDVGYGAAQDGLFTSTYAQPVSRLRWQITEDLLIGRLAYERVEGTDGKGAGRETEDGVVVVAYPIESHFDIVRAYNPTTGEQLNIYEENTTDRPWNQREYMRVDWSRNLNVDSYDFDTLSMVGIYGGVTYEPLAYDVTDPGDPNAPTFDLEHGYFDVTNKAFARPGLIDLSYLGWGIDTFPACYLDADFSGGSAPSGSCNPVELTIRQSFRRVENSDFEPQDWDGIRFQAYGGFYTDRYGYARNYGMSDDLWRRFLNHHQIWERTHFYADPAAMTGPLECYTPATTPFGKDPHRDELGADGSDGANGTEDECEAAGAGSRCDTFTQRCTLPYVQRTTRTLAWYYTHDSDPEFFLPTKWAAHQWDVALRMAVRASQYAECQATGGADCAARFPVLTGQQDEYEDAIALAAEVDDCRDSGRSDCDGLADELATARGYGSAIVSLSRMPDMVVLCHSPVEASDPLGCGGPRLPAGTTAAQCETAYDDPLADAALLETCHAALNVRRGDLRYHQVNVIPEPQTPSPWGIMVDSIDPLTGESIAASINVWSFVNDIWSQDVVDKLRYLRGEYATEDVTNGTYVRNWALAAQSAAGGGVLPMMTRAERDQRLADFAGGPVADPAAVPAGLAGEIRAMDRDLREVSASLDASSSTSSIYEARRRQARGTEFEAELMTPMVQQLHGVNGLPLNDTLLDVSSPLRGGNPEFRQQIERLKEEALARRGACILHPDEAEEPFSLTGLAAVLEAKFGAFNPADDPVVQQERAERMREYVALRGHFAVIAHEMGHSIGLRHNFISSSDAWQYRPQYWQLRTRNGAVTTECTELAADGATCVGPRYFDPVTPEERDNLIWMWMQSSVMDYAGEATQDMIGLGVYDFAATRMLYGETVAVNAEDRFRSGTTLGSALLDLQDTFGGILGLGYTLGDEDIHYSQLQKDYGLIGDCVDVPDPQVYKPRDWDESLLGEWSPLMDGLMVQVDGQWSRCKQQKVDYVPWTSLEPATSSGTSPAVDPQGRVRMPYGFATDRWADLGNLSVYRHDNGADPYEIFNFMITSQEMWQIFDAYRRHRQTFSVRNASNRVLERYNAKIRDGAKGLGLMRNIYKDFALHQGYDFDTFWGIVAGFYPDNILASGLAFDHFARTLARPEIGPHFRYGWDDVLRSAMDTPGTPGDTLVVVPNGASGYYGTIGMGGKLVENQLCGTCGEFDSDYTMNAGSYYDKMNAAMLMTESVDNFISASRTDFVDPRYRAVSLADLFPEGYRRWLANNLTGDDLLKGPRVAANARGVPLKDGDGYPSEPIGWTTWWSDTPKACFPAEGTTICSSYNMPTEDPFDPRAPEHVAVLDPQVGWEQQKFLIAWTMLYLMENEETHWLDQMRVWELGSDADPAFAERVEFHSPDGKVYVARTSGKEDIFGETVQKGVAARVLEYADGLLAAAYETTDGPDLDGDTMPDWHLAVNNPATGMPTVRWDSTVSQIDGDGYIRPDGVPGCNATENFGCTCTANRSCVALGRYLSVPAYLREAVSAYRLGEPDPRGVY